MLTCVLGFCRALVPLLSLFEFQYSSWLQSFFENICNFFFNLFIHIQSGSYYSYFKSKVWMCGLKEMLLSVNVEMIHILRNLVNSLSRCFFILYFCIHISSTCVCLHLLYMELLRLCIVISYPSHSCLLLCPPRGPSTPFPHIINGYEVNLDSPG